MDKQDWENTYTEKNAKAEMWGAGIAGIFFLFPVILIIAFWNPTVLFTIPLLFFWISHKRRKNKK